MQIRTISSAAGAVNPSRLEPWAKKLDSHVDCLKKLLESKSIETEDEEDFNGFMEFVINMPLHEAEKKIQEEMNQLEELSRSVEQKLAVIETRLPKIEIDYLQAKRFLEEKAKAIQEKQEEQRREEIEWATQDCDHVMWALKQKPSYRYDLACRYQARHGYENVPALLKTAPVPAPTSQKVHKTKTHSDTALLSNGIIDATPPSFQEWKFWFTFNGNHPGQELPQERDLFLQNLQLILHKADYHNLDVRLCYDSLIKITKVNRQQRLQMDEVQEGEFEKWKILRLGRKHRLFLSINEETQHIIFAYRPRTSSYVRGK